MNDVVAVGEDANPLEALAASAVREALIGAAKLFGRESGRSVRLSFDTSGGVARRIGEGARPHLLASSLASLTDLATRGALGGPPVRVGASRLALGVRIGEAAPDVSSVENFCAALRAAGRIARGDPAGGGTAGNLLVALFQRLGIFDEVREKSVLRVGGYRVMQAVADGEADFGLTQSTEIPPVAGVEIGAFLPPEIQTETVYAIAPGAAADADARAFCEALATPPYRAIFDRAGFFPA